MKNPKQIMEQQPQVVPQILSPSSSGRRSRSSSSSFSNSPEFEFWMLRNPSNFPQSNLLSSADQLFSGGFLLPLHPQPPNPETTTKNPNQDQEEDPPQIREPDPGPQLSSSTTTLTPSKRWTDIFKKSDKKSEDNNKDKDKNKKKERRGNGATSAELNINIWPFSRSRSAGSRPPRMVSASTTARKVSSAPCSRSNSAGESKSRKWPASPARGGVHLGRNSPVWQVRRGAGVHSKAPLAAGGGGGGGRAKVLNLNVPMCIGYRNHLSCKSDVINSAVVVKAGDTGVAAAQNGDVGSGDGGRGGNMFNLRSLFTRKVY